jgi:hypothetical protein
MKNIQGGVRERRPYCAGPTPTRIKKVSDFPTPSRDVTKPNYAWPGIIKLFPARESLVRDIPAGEGKIANLFLQCIIPAGMVYLLLRYIFDSCSQPFNVLAENVNLACVDGGSCTCSIHLPMTAFTRLPAPLYLPSLWSQRISHTIKLTYQPTHLQAGENKQTLYEKMNARTYEAQCQSLYGKKSINLIHFLQPYHIPFNI